MTVRPSRHLTLVAALLLCTAFCAGAQDEGPDPITDMSIRRAVVQELLTLDDENVTCLAFLSDTELICGTDGGRVFILHVVEGTELRELQSHESAVTSVSPSPDGQWIASSGLDGWVYVTNLEDESQSQAMSHIGAVHEVEFSPQGTYLGSVGAERRIRLWETSTWDERDSITGHTDTVYALAFSPAEDLLVTGAGGSDPSIRLWDLATGDLLQNDFYEGDVNDIEYSPRERDRHASVSGTQRMIRLWEVDRGAMLHNVGRFSDAVNDAAYSSLGNTLVAVSQDGSLFFTVMPSWTEKRRITYEQPLLAVAFCTSRRYIAFSDNAGHLYTLSVPE